MRKTNTLGALVASAAMSSLMTMLPEPIVSRPPGHYEGSRYRRRSGSGKVHKDTRHPFVREGFPTVGDLMVRYDAQKGVRFKDGSGPQRPAASYRGARRNAARLARKAALRERVASILAERG